MLPIVFSLPRCQRLQVIRWSEVRLAIAIYILIFVGPSCGNCGNQAAGGCCFKRIAEKNGKSRATGISQWLNVVDDRRVYNYKGTSRLKNHCSASSRRLGATPMTLDYDGLCRMGGASAQSAQPQGGSAGHTPWHAAMSRSQVGQDGQAIAALRTPRHENRVFLIYLGLPCASRSVYSPSAASARRVFTITSLCPELQIWA